MGGPGSGPKGHGVMGNGSLRDPHVKDRIKGGQGYLTSSSKFPENKAGAKAETATKSAEDASTKAHSQNTEQAHVDASHAHDAAYSAHHAAADAHEAAGHLGVADAHRTEADGHAAQAKLHADRASAVNATKSGTGGPRNTSGSSIGKDVNATGARLVINPRTGKRELQY